MIQLTETYTWQQAAAISRLDKLEVELKMVSFAIEEPVTDIFSLSQYAAVEGMKIFAQRLDDDWYSCKDDVLKKFPTFNFDKCFRIKIYDYKPTGKQISFDEFAGADAQNQSVNVKDYTKWELAYVLLEPPYGIRLPITAKPGSYEYYATKTKEYTALYHMFLNDFLLLSQYKKEDFIIYSWSDDWSDFFDAGKEWWGTYYCTIYNKRNNTIIVLGASATD